MMSVIHAMFARELYEHIYLMYGVRLKKNSLIYGSIKPDVTTLFAKYPHYIDKSLNMLCERVEALRDVVMFDRGVKTRSFARELGVASHYIADYFCRVHNDINGIKHDEHIIHVIYEQNMSMKISQSYLDVIREKVLNEIEAEIERVENSDIKTYILRNHEVYMKEAGAKGVCTNKRKQFAVDIEYAMKMILVIGSCICKGA